MRCGFVAAVALKECPQFIGGRFFLRIECDVAQFGDRKLVFRHLIDEFGKTLDGLLN